MKENEIKDLVKRNPFEYYLCPDCNGRGTITIKENKDRRGPKNIICKKCQGRGYLDWVENIVGRKALSYEDIVDCSPTTYREISIEEKIRKEVVENLAKKIDEEIMNSVYYNNWKCNKPTKSLVSDKIFTIVKAINS